MYIDSRTLHLQQSQIQKVLNELLLKQPRLSNEFLHNPREAFHRYLDLQFESGLKITFSLPLYNNTFHIVLPKKLESTVNQIKNDDLDVVAGGVAPAGWSSTSIIGPPNMPSTPYMGLPFGINSNNGCVVTPNQVIHNFGTSK